MPERASSSCAAVSALNIDLAVTDNVVFRHGGNVTTPPHLLKMLLSTVVSTEERKPICIVLPSTDEVGPAVAMLAALECLASDLPATSRAFAKGLRARMKVRLPPGGEVFEIASVEKDGSLRLLMTDKATYQSNGTRIAGKNCVFWFEPTTRTLPLGTQFTPFRRPPPNQLDLIVRTQMFGNSGLVRTRVFLAGPRAEFERAVRALPIEARDAPELPPVASAFHYGGVDENGRPYVVEPGGSAGQPLVAIERDLLDMQQAFLAAEVEQGSRVLVTDRVDMICRDLDLAARVAERQRLVLFADAARRSEVAGLSDRGWTVWEPSPHEILGSDASLNGTTGCEGIDASIRGAAAEILRSPGFLTCKAPSLARADNAIAVLGRHLGDESVEHEPWVEELLDRAQGAFFACAGWLITPNGSELQAASLELEQVRRDAARVRLHLGLEAEAAVHEVADALDEFRRASSPGVMTGKGEELLRLARTARKESFRQVFVTGSRQSREAADAFFGKNDLRTQCATVRDLRESTDVAGVVAFSVLRRDHFERLVDPWPSPNTLFVGYEFEAACYRRRLGIRHAVRRRLSLSPDRRGRLTRVPASAFAAPQVPAPDPVQPADIVHLEGFDRATREWNWASRINVPRPRQGEETCPARIVRFAGRSWIAMTSEHDSQRLQRNALGRSAVRPAHVAELSPGDWIIVREGGDRDVIRILAEDRVGEAKYTQLRQNAGLWRRVLLVAAGNGDTGAVRRRLEAIGVRRNPVTIRAWMTNDNLIGPRSQDDLQAIQKAFGPATIKGSDWKKCFEAIQELRALHISAGSDLTDVLAARCGKMLIEPSDTEMAVDLGIGTVWLLQVASVEDKARECPASYVNRLQWLDQNWKARLLATRIRERSV